MAKRKAWKGFRSQQVARRPENQRQEFAIEQRIEGRFYSGPLPPASELQAFADVSPTYPDRIFAMAEKEQIHRHSLEQSRMGAHIWLSKSGQFFGLMICVVFVLTAGFLIYHDKNIGGFAALIAGLTTLIGPFLYRAQAERRIAKNPEQAPEPTR